jgi:hypothetical protein
MSQEPWPRRRLQVSVLLVALVSGACAAGEGEVEVRVWGEAFIEEGIPAAAVTDGWAIDLPRFEVELRDVSVAGASFDAPDPFDLAQTSDGVGQLVGRASVAAGEYDDAAFTIARVQLEGSAEKGGVVKNFAWTFDMPIDHEECDTSTEVPRDGVGELQITVHADHLFYDSLVSEQPALRFDAIAAADVDADGEVTMAELAATDIGAYDPGNLAIDDLWSFLAAQAQTMGHVDGEGHCQS